MLSDNKEMPLILVLENEEETRDGIEELLRADGYRVDAAQTKTTL